MKIRFDRACATDLLELIMKVTAYQKLLGKKQIALGVILALLFYGFMCVQLVPYTFSEDPTVAKLQACFAAIPIATTFWFAVNMFMIVLSDQRRQKKEAK